MFILTYKVRNGVGRETTKFDTLEDLVSFIVLEIGMESVMWAEFTDEFGKVHDIEVRQ